jgi:hypothetical protein
VFAFKHSLGLRGPHRPDRLWPEQGGRLQGRGPHLQLLRHRRVHGARGGEPQGPHARVRLVVAGRPHVRNARRHSALRLQGPQADHEPDTARQAAHARVPQRRGAVPAARPLQAQPGQPARRRLRRLRRNTPPPLLRPGIDDRPNIFMSTHFDSF